MSNFSYKDKERKQEEILDLLLTGLRKTYQAGGMDYSVARDWIRRHVESLDRDKTTGIATKELLFLANECIEDYMALRDLNKTKHAARQVLKNLAKLQFKQEGEI